MCAEKNQRNMIAADIIERAFRINLGLVSRDTYMLVQHSRISYLAGSKRNAISSHIVNVLSTVMESS